MDWKVTRDIFFKSAKWILEYVFFCGFERWLPPDQQIVKRETFPLQINTDFETVTPRFQATVANILEKVIMN